MNAGDLLLAAELALRGILVVLDPATGTFVLAPEMVSEAERTLVDGTLACLVEARELHRKGRYNDASRLQLIVHLRGLELRSKAMVEAARHVLCADAAPCRTERREHLS